MLAIAADVVLAAALKMDAFPIRPENAGVLVKVLMAVGVLLLLAYVRAVDSKETT
jgi:hypothetical protein